jgi:hypothetical protein
MCKKKFRDANSLIQIKYDEEMKDFETYLLVTTSEEECRNIKEECRDNRKECTDIQRDVNLFVF